MLRVSVIIPCYNLGEYIHEAIDSVLAQTLRDFEIIVVNDGSTERRTNLILAEINHPKVKVISTDNQGLPRARNNGIAEARGEYILPLDADDKIAPTYLEKATKILDENENVGIVYCRAETFGDENLSWDLPEYELSKILVDNVIFSTAFFRRRDWETTGGYKPTMIYGWEDYEFWMSLIELKREIYRIPESLFFYRKRCDSMTEKIADEHFYYSYKEIVRNHPQLYIDNIDVLFRQINSLRGLIAEKKRQDSKSFVFNLKFLELGIRFPMGFFSLRSRLKTLASRFSSLFGQSRKAKSAASKL